ncbi:MAG TPA: hypothetical protein VJ842_16625 [Pyrinomonadaceae bacterium]|nr:hypothetical protein [Pyrinomonadaceae bacterium]
MLKLRWRRKTTTTDETGARAPGDAPPNVEEKARVEAATQAGGAHATQDEAGIRESLEVVKTAIVWLVVINILTVLSPLLWLSLKWTIVVGVLLTASSIVIGCVTYLRARATQRRIPE